MVSNGKSVHYQVGDEGIRGVISWIEALGCQGYTTGLRQRWLPLVTMFGCQQFGDRRIEQSWLVTYDHLQVAARPVYSTTS